MSMILWEKDFLILKKEGRGLLFESICIIIKPRRNMKAMKMSAKTIYTLVVLAIHAAVYPVIIFRCGGYATEIYYGGIVLCLLTALVFLRKELQTVLQAGALAFTCAADLFLILLGKHRLLAMCFFLTAQMFYAARTLLYAKSKREKLYNVGARAIGSVLISLIAALVLKEETNALIIVSLIYYVNLLVSIVFAYLHFGDNKLLPIGLTLFALCDVFVGFAELIHIFSLTENHIIYKLTHLPVYLDSVFYHPSQVLLSFSGQDRIKDGKNL